jgi:hypothetical protein
MVEPAWCEHRDESLLDGGARAIDSIAALKVSNCRLMASGPFDLIGPWATTHTVTGGIGFSPGTRNNVPALSMSA